MLVSQIALSLLLMLTPGGSVAAADNAAESATESPAETGAESAGSDDFAPQSPADAPAGDDMPAGAQAEDTSGNVAPSAVPPGTEAAAPHAPAAAESAEPAPKPSDTPSQADNLSLDAWRRDDWVLVKPKVSLLELDGYFRIRSDLLRRLDFDTGAYAEGSIDANANPRYSAMPDGSADYSSTSMRLRVEPRININERLQIISTIDMMDNLILGSTPDTWANGQPSVMPDILSGRQLVPRRGDNALTDSVVVKRLWARVTALNEQLELRVGRMPDHFGLGMLYNNGDCLDCDWGNNADRLAVAFRAFDHVFMPMVDWVYRGPSLRPFGFNDPAPIDAASFDDVMQYGLRVMREDHPDDVRDAVNHGKGVVNYGVSQVFRTQPRSYANSLYTLNTTTTAPFTQPTRNSEEERRDAFLYVGDVYSKYYLGPWELGAEVAVQAGYFTDRLPGSVGNAALQKTDVFKLGGAFEGRYRSRPDGRGVQLSMKAGGASGDNAPGYGALDYADTQRGGSDRALHNFQFSPDYRIDLLMYRRIIGTVTDSWYLRPEVAYQFDDKVMGRLNAVYSQAIRTNSTPSAQSNTPAKPMGLEFDAELSYGLQGSRDEGQLMASLAGGVLFPLGGFHTASNKDSSFAWTLQARMYLTF